MNRAWPAAVCTDRGLDRFITFLDAVVAIAITLLVLPLAEVLGGEYRPAHTWRTCSPRTAPGSGRSC